MFAPLRKRGASVQAFALIGACLLAVLSPALAGDADAKIHHLVLQIDENDEAKMSLVLNNARNVTDVYTAKAEEVQIEIVAYGPGLHMLREDTAPEQIRARVKSFAESMPNVAFSACNQTRIGMAKAEGKKPDDIPLVKTARVVPAGVVRLMELQEQGWTYVRP